MKSFTVKMIKYLITYEVEVTENEYVLLPTKHRERREKIIEYTAQQFSIKVTNDLLALDNDRITHIYDIKNITTKR